jgi:Na+/melibiose symporter-like transporter
MQAEESTMLAGEELARELELESTGPLPVPQIKPLSLSQSLLYGVGGIAGGLVFTMMNNALPLFLLAYTMPLGLPALLNPGGPVPATVVALLTNERSLFGGLIQPFVGHLSDRTRSRIGKRGPFLLVGGLGTALCIALLALQPPFWVMVAAVTLAGVSLFVALGPYSALLADITPYTQRGRIGSLIAIAGVVGALTFSLLSIGLWGSARGWVFLITAVLVFVSLAVVALWVREPEHNASAHQEHLSIRSLPKVLAQEKPLAIYVLSMAIYWLGAGAASPFITRFGVKELGIPEETSFVLLLMVVIATSAGAVLFGWLGDKFGRKRVLQPALILFAIAALLGSQVHDLSAAIPVMLLVGLGNAAPTALHLPLLADLVPHNRAGVFMGYANMVWSVAQPVGALAAGLLVDATQSYRSIFIMAAACMVVASLVMRGLPNGHTHK